MIQLLNGCRRSEFNVVPQNWITSKAKLTLSWYADCRFIDPLHLDKYPKGKLIRLKGGVNRFNTIQERRLILKSLIEEMEERFKKGYNPVTENLINSSKKIQDNYNANINQEVCHINSLHCVNTTPFGRFPVHPRLMCSLRQFRS